MDRKERGGGGAAGGQFLEDDRGVEPAHLGAADIALHIDAGETERRCFAHHIDGEVFLLVPFGRKRRQPLAGETARRVLDRALVFVQLEIHQ